ncbi:hypothetical protein GWN42_21260 [candidate division KSB1 bacterium]|nr:hypothetical protein [Phycisphaerae bacterium]NIU10716.1 hypothetical protein [Phycisphaerae bacterium]NIV95247.1 hypothetical protein [candidate division KSB1 bacterium]
MDSDRVNRWLTLGANVGVLIGIILLLIELNQNSMLMRGQTRNDVSSELIGLMSQVSNNPQLADLIYRVEHGEQVTPQEMLQYRARQISNIRYFENVFYQYRQGLYDEIEYLAHRQAWVGVWSQARHDFWCNYRQTVSPDFRAEIEGLITEYAC